MEMNPLKKTTILLTSGPTYAFLDAVRVISNRSTGRLGSTIASTLVQSGASVIQLSGENSVSALDLNPHLKHSSLEVRRFSTVDHLKQLMQDQLRTRKIDALIMSAAVLDYLPADPLQEKRRSSDEEWVVRFERGEKLIEQIRHWNSEVLIVGFKLETKLSLDELTTRARDLMGRSDAELVVANRLEEIDEHRHIAYIMERTPEGITLSDPLKTREEIAATLTQRLAEHLSWR